MAHRGLSLIGQAPGCSNCGNHIPLASPWRLAPFRGIKIFPGAATVGITFPRLPLAPGVILRHQNIPGMRCSCGKYFPCLLQASVGGTPTRKKIPLHCGAGSTYIRHIYIPFNKYLFGYKSGGGFFFLKKSGKKRKNTQKIPLFFGGIASGHPDDPLSIKLTQHGSIYGLGACFLWAKIPIGCTGICRDRGWAKTGRSAPAIPFS